MKTLTKLLIINLPFIIIVSLPFSCEDRFVESYKANVPVYMSYEELRSSVNQDEPFQLKNPGKLYFKDNYIFINENQEGVHVIDNSDPSNPQNVTFVNIPGNVDISIKDDILYADSYVDLVAIDISDLEDIKEVDRIEDVFPYIIPYYDVAYQIENVDEQKGIVVDWKVKEVEKSVDYNQPRYPVYPHYDYMRSMETMSQGKVNSSGSGNTSSFGIGGSMARFTIAENTLYALHQNSLKIFDITSPTNMLSNGDKAIGWGMETIFPYNDHLFIGTQTGMLIYNISTPTNPLHVSTFSHIRSCDPVVVDEDYAYVTLRDGNNCGETVNQLDVVNIRNYSKPFLVKSYPMTNPHGLGIDDKILFICDGDAGLKIYDAADPSKIKENHLVTFGDMNTYDVIPVNDILLMIGSDGFYQYDYSDIYDISLLSHIPVLQED
jgi:hypothetical protein